MTIYITSSSSTLSLAFNTPNLNTQHTLKLISQWSNDETLSLTLVPFVANDRYSEFTAVVPAGLTDEHKNGIYTYQLLSASDVIETGLVKLILNPGGTTGTEPYISNNEDREGVVYYRPQY